MMLSAGIRGSSVRKKRCMVGGWKLMPFGTQASPRVDFVLYKSSSLWCTRVCGTRGLPRDHIAWRLSIASIELSCVIVVLRGRCRGWIT